MCWRISRGREKNVVGVWGCWLEWVSAGAVEIKDIMMSAIDFEKVVWFF